jgi:DNA helicase-2/ATP-dependent DNA helicase PcrA
MASRLLEIAGEQAEGVHVSTFHSLGLSILREQCSAVGLRRNLKVCDKEHQLKLCEQVFEHLEPHLFDGLDVDNVQDLQRGILDAKLSGESVESLLASADNYDQLIGEALQAYNELLQQSNSIDMDDMIVLPAQILEADAQVRAFYQERFRYLMVDEYQDTNQIQYRLICSLLGPQKNFCVVGDDAQSIYSFRGANRELILNFATQFSGAKVVTLSECYRCSTEILSVANTVIGACEQGHKKNLVSANGSSAPVRFVDISDAINERQYIADDVKRSKRRCSDIAILFRGQKDAQEMRSTLALNGVPHGSKQKGVTVMTLHASKGLQFPVVYLPGVQEDNLPHWNAINDGSAAIEEERRLFYVGVTRAEQLLTLSAIQTRGRYACYRSRFATELLDLPKVEYLDLAS